MFILRARVEIAVSGRTLRGVFTVPSAPLALEGAMLGPAPLACAAGEGWFATRAAGDPARVIVALDPGAPDPLEGLGPMAGAGPADWRLADIRAGVPTLGPATVEAYLPQMLNLDVAGGIAFAKGCYAGQEVITRTRHRGRVKRRMLRFAAPPGALPEAGATVYGLDGEIGQVITAAATPDGAEWLAVVQLEEAARGAFADAARARPLERLPLPYPVPAD
jgi:folate-binding protein YgfZ